MEHLNRTYDNSRCPECGGKIVLGVKMLLPDGSTPWQCENSHVFSSTKALPATIRIGASTRILADTTERDAEARKKFFAVLEGMVDNDNSVTPVRMNSYGGLSGACYEVILPDNWIEQFATAGFFIGKCGDYFSICEDRNDLVGCANIGYIWPETNILVYKEGSL